MYTKEEIELELPKLLEKWDLIKDGFKNAKLIESRFKTLKTLLKRLKISLNESSWLDELNANENYKLLKYYLSQKEISYDEICLSTPPSDRIKVFIEHAPKFSDKEYWQELASAYIMQNYKKIPYKTYHKLFSENRQFKEFLMNEEEQKCLNEMPSNLTIYRGGSFTEQKTKKYGISWTLNREIAENFSNVKSIRDRKDMVVISKEINKEQVVAYFKNRQEEEIIFLG